MGIDHYTVKRADLFARNQLRLFLKPVVRILILVDEGISFNQYYFGLSEVLDTLYGLDGRPNEAFARFEITRVHRSTDPEPPLDPSLHRYYKPNAENFRFTGATLSFYSADGAVASTRAFDLDDYHEVWFFGFNSNTNNADTPVGSPPPDALTDAELSILATWMEKKAGGVFATGDHATLGAALCSRIPRVRSMRRWTNAPPPQSGPNRHDTSRPGRDYAPSTDNEAAYFSFDDESDDIPQRIDVRRFLTPLGKGKLRRSVHPILCGRNGIINVLPDHPHEGEVVVPTDLTKTITFPGYSGLEYPEYRGAPLEPLVIADAEILEGITDTNSFKGECNPKSFGVIGAWNGHLVSEADPWGRVVVDSTWHHWFDVNLTGRMRFGTSNSGFNAGEDADDPAKLLGFNATADGRDALAKIREYFRNVAIWLAPPAVQRRMVRAAVWEATHSYPLIEELKGSIDPDAAGAIGYDVLMKMWGACSVIWYLPILIREWPPVFIERPHPELVFEDALAAERLVLGHLMLALRDAKKPGDVEELDEHVERGLARGLDALRARPQLFTAAQHMARFDCAL
jgi:hypothetical protein